MTAFPMPQKTSDGCPARSENVASRLPAAAAQVLPGQKQLLDFQPRPMVSRKPVRQSGNSPSANGTPAPPSGRRSPSW